MGNIFRQQAIEARESHFCARINYRSPWRLELAAICVAVVFVLFVVIVAAWRFPDYRSFPARVFAAQPAVEIRSDAAAYISKLSIRPGEKVTQGQVVAELRSWMVGQAGRSVVREQQDALLAELHGEVAQLELQRQARLRQWTATQTQITQLNRLLTDMARLRELRVDEHRRVKARYVAAQTLSERGWLANANLDQEKGQLDTAEIQLIESVNNLHHHYQQLEALHQRQWQLVEQQDSDQLSFQSRQRAIHQQIYTLESNDHLTIVAPEDGIVDWMPVREGQLVDSQALLFSLAPGQQDYRVKFILSADERYRVGLTTPVKLRLAGERGRQLGLIDAALTTLASSSVITDSGQGYWAEAVIRSDSLAASHLVDGLPVTVDVELSQATLLERAWQHLPLERVNL
ncbi:HlyD family efflux transporter periplasmic adaptor subunit [Umboniibacter marinipuniceus]|uniref:HlyD family secretion protein n=1 Tax=Umboniibacter marinipuniceus TaxID=569599 RepID=A0A3M0A632_9GAMM|nr:HlyD family efflux transporter periplasmic adaptor subunit [Umboniibacter marinipuniceus]RMA80240.1 HlyD family secretion protein [Umboniibacter marinipuniceus]